MAEPGEVPDHLKVRGHLVPKEDWPGVKASAAEYAAEDTDDIGVPEPDEEDWDDDDPDSEERDNSTPDEMSREETLHA